MRKTVRSLMVAGWLAVTGLAAQALEVGDAVPMFTAESTHGTIDVAALLRRGPVVLAFYYADFTPV